MDLFSGAGGLSLGFIEAGFEIVAAYEKWLPSVNIYKANLRHPVFEMNLNEVDEATDHIKNFNPDVIIGGPPCQDFSSAGNRVEGAKAHLTICFASIIENIRPSIFVMENVARSQSSQAVLTAREKMEKIGYCVKSLVLDASKCGTPQKRKRFFMLGALEDIASIEGVIDENTNDRSMSVSDYMELDTKFYYRHPRNYTRRGIFSVDEPSPTIRCVNRPIPPNYPGHPADAAPVNFARPLTTEERARIQTFPANWKWTGSKTEVETMIGNAVPVNLAKFVGQNLRECLNV